MGLLTFAGRIVLVIANIVFMLTSICLIIFGFILKFAHEVIRPFVKDVLDEIEDTVKKISSDTDFNTENFDLGSMVSNVALCFIVIGFGLLAISLIGCCGSCYSYQILMLIYAIVVTALLLAQIVTVIVVYGFPGEIKRHIESPLKKSLDEYQGINGTTVVSIGWNWAMQQYDCCGVKDYKDFTDKPMWTNKDVHLTPIACCKVLPDNDAEKNSCAGNKTNPSLDDITEIAVNSNYDQGCLDRIWKVLFEDNKTYFLLGCCFCFAAQILLIIFAVLVYQDRGIKGGLV